MYSATEIQDCAQTIAKQFSPERIILFGSHADGSANMHSDVDLLVIMAYEGKASKVALEIRRKLNKRFPLDLVVKKPAEAKLRIAQGDSFLKSAFQNGKVLYERS
jgi:predicted nucleotidyltransferase